MMRSQMNIRPRWTPPPPPRKRSEFGTWLLVAGVAIGAAVAGNVIANAYPPLARWAKGALHLPDMKLDPNITDVIEDRRDVTPVTSGSGWAPSERANDDAPPAEHRDRGCDDPPPWMRPWVPKNLPDPETRYPEYRHRPPPRPQWEGR